MEDNSEGKISRSKFLKLTSLGLGTLVFQPLIGATDTKKIDKNVLADSTFYSPISLYTPERLHKNTHYLAQKALGGNYGRTLVNADWPFPERDDESLSLNKKYAAAALSLAKNAPLRIEYGELIAGSATIKESSQHKIPLLNMDSASHTTPDFSLILKVGYKGIREQINEKLKSGSADEKGKDLLESMITVLDAASLWHKRYIERLKELASTSNQADADFYNNIILSLKNVPENPPQTFREAVQSLWFAYAFQRLMGNWLGLGRLDVMLNPYLEKDLKDKSITLDEAREVLAHFWIKGCEWIGGNQNGSGDAQFYQNVILAGVDKSGKEVVNNVSYLILDVVEELHISDYPIAVRMRPDSPEKLFKKVASVQRFGGGIVSVYNENTVIEGLVKFGYPLEEAREFTNDGCWEAIIPGKSAFIYVPSDMTRPLAQTLKLNEEINAPLTYSNFSELYDSFKSNLDKEIDGIQNSLDNAWKSSTPNPLLSMIVEGCIEKGRGYYDRGPKYSVTGIHYGGVSDTANSLYVLKKLVFDEKFVSLDEFRTILKHNWEGNEVLRQLIKNRITFYGNDNEEADSMMCKVFNDYTAIVNKTKERNGVYRPCGISTFGREIDWRMMRAASAEGSKTGDILATNCSPTPGSDKKGPTSVINSYCKLDFSNSPNGATVELKILPASLKGENGIKALTALTKTFCEKKGFYMHIDVVDSATLIDAQKNPERYKNLPVRVAGWSARFNTLSKEWQDMVIQRTQQSV